MSIDTILYNDKELLSPKLDLVFKGLFGVENSKKALMSLLNDTFGMNIKNVDDITLTNTELVPESHDGKLSRLDICLTVKNEKKEHINIEIQLVNEHNIMKRVMFYLAKLYSGQLPKAGKYNELAKSICVVILDYTYFDDDRWIHRGRTLDIETHIEFTDCMEVVFIELPKLPKDISSVTDKSQLWLLLLNARTEEELKMLIAKNPEIAATVDRLEELSLDTKFQHQALVREKAVRDYYSSMATAKDEGRDERNIEIAQNLIAMNLNTNDISKATGLTIEQIEELKSQL